MNENLQHKMFKQIANKKLLNKANAYAVDYLDQAFERSVFPIKQAIKDPKKFDQPLPEATTDPLEILEQLHQYGSPATVS